MLPISRFHTRIKEELDNLFTMPNRKKRKKSPSFTQVQVIGYKPQPLLPGFRGVLLRLCFSRELRSTLGFRRCPLLDDSHVVIIRSETGIDPQ